ncbi:MAG: hypothetical protein VCA34_10915 [Roseibacillus sp.]
MNEGKKLTGVLGALLLLGGVADACTVPVFRYALDRWQSDAYRFEVPVGWMKSEQAAELRKLLAETATEVDVVELEGADSPARFLMPTEEETVTWSGRLDGDITALFTSPMREELANQLLAGESMVWVMVPCGDEAKDKPFEEQLTARLKYLDSVAAIPEQDPNDPESQLGPGPELRVGFAFLKLDQDDPKEQFFLRMLAGPGGAELLKSDEPFAGVVFGRGRVLGAWSAADLDDEGIDEVSLFLLGACSCRVKFQNPGWDLAMAVDWDARLLAAQMAADREFEEAPAQPVVTEGNRSDPANESEVVSFGEESADPDRSEVKTGSIIVIVVGAMAVFGGLVALIFFNERER